jgi:predicted negative regulator of RcsB-dependent stress response
MAVDVNKLIADAKAAQAAARTAAAKAQAQASRDKIDAETRARSKSQTDYANSLKPRLEQYESQLAIWARKIARGDKLSAVEQKEFDAALVQLTEPPAPFAGLYADRRGDVLAAQGKGAGAREAWTQAIEALGVAHPLTPVVKLKLDALGASAPRSSRPPRHAARHEPGSSVARSGGWWWWPVAVTALPTASDNLR